MVNTISRLGNDDDLSIPNSVSFEVILLNSLIYLYFTMSN